MIIFTINLRPSAWMRTTVVAGDEATTIYTEDGGVVRLFWDSPEQRREFAARMAETARDVDDQAATQPKEPTK